MPHSIGGMLSAVERRTARKALDTVWRYLHRTEDAQAPDWEDCRDAVDAALAWEPADDVKIIQRVAQAGVRLAIEYPTGRRVWLSDEIIPDADAATFFRAYPDLPAIFENEDGSPT